MDENMLQVFRFEDTQKIRIVDVNGEPWIVVKDLMQALSYGNKSTPSALTATVPEEWKGIKRIDTLNGTQSMTCLSEQGMYFFLSRSDKPKALPFQKWIAGDVIPSIRKTGAYMLMDKTSVTTDDAVASALADPRAMARMLTAYADMRDRNLELEVQVTSLEENNLSLTKEVNLAKLVAMKNKSKVEFATVMHTLDDTSSIGSYAKALDPKGRILGQNRLFKWFRENKYAMYSGKFNVPTQRSIVNGWLKLVEDHKELSNGERMLIQITRVTMKGQAYFTKKLLEEFKELRPNV